MMATHDGAGGHIKSSSSAPVKWTLVEAEPEKPEGRRSKQREGYGRARAHGSGGSSSTSNWRNGREGGRGRGGQAFSGGYRGGRRGGGGRGGGRSSSRHNSGYGRSRGHGAGRGYMGATYYPTPYFNEPSFEEQRVYMTNLAVEQIEFYFTVENLCRDIFMRSYMDEEGYIPIAFVANFPGVARFGVELQDIVAGLLASDLLQVDTVNETMRMREGWEVWLLPNQATGRRGVPRYIKVDSATFSDEATLAEFDDTAQSSSKPHRGDASDGGIGAAKTDEPIVNEGSEEDPIATNNLHFDDSTGLTPTAAAWTPGGSLTTSFEQEKPLRTEVVKKG